MTLIGNGIEDEEKWLAEGIAGIQHYAFYMHRALVLAFQSNLRLTDAHVSFLQPWNSLWIFLDFDFLRMQTILGKLSNTLLKCCPNFEPRSFRLINTSNSVKISSLIDLCQFWSDRSRSHPWSLWFCLRYASIRRVKEAGTVFQGGKQAWGFNSWPLWTCTARWKHIAQIVSHSCFNFMKNSIMWIELCRWVLD